MSVAFIYPGQGSQNVGMGSEIAKAFSSAREVFEEIDDALNQNLSKLMFEGPEEDLILTQNAQPAIMAVSLAVMRVLSVEGGINVSKSATCVAGHSLGEYSALAASGCFEVSETARLLKTRGLAMQEAVPLGKGGMAAIVGLDLEEIVSIASEAAEDGVCEAANDNAPGQVVISGEIAAIDRAIELAKKRGAKRAINLPVSAPFHCSLMEPAAGVMSNELTSVNMSELKVPFVSNVTANIVNDIEEIKKLLVEQVTGMVRWRESVLTMKSIGVDNLVEIGVGKVLSGLVRRIDKDLKIIQAGTPETIEELLKNI
ncbi:MAG: ACP S-malonyltransferase [Pseudomonadota bacterium]|nr:ACP S-malonyltransferase [Pseudomonadota bacterium]